MKAKRVTAEGFVSNVYEQKFNLPEDVDTEKLTSVLHLTLLFSPFDCWSDQGMSRDGILMIRVPRRVEPEPEKTVAIQRDVEIKAVKKALAGCWSASVDVEEVKTRVTSALHCTALSR